MSSIFSGTGFSGGGAAAPYVSAARKVRRVRGYTTPNDLLASRGVQRLRDSSSSIPSPKQQRTRYFMDPALQKRYYGVKRQIGYRKTYPLRDFWDLPISRGSGESLQRVGASWKAATEQQRMNRRSYNMTGRGKYMQGRGGFFGGLGGLLTGQGWKAGSDAGDRVWDAAKGFVPIPQLHALMAASDVANKVAQPIATATGYGKYKSGRGLYRGMGVYKGRGTYAANTIVQDSGATSSSIVPRFSMDDVTTITLSNREYVRDVFAPAVGTVFQVEQWPLNPGMSTAFPWLAQIAINFEEYEIVQLIYTFKSTVADFASSTGQVGQVIMATQYNPNSDAFADKEEMMLYDGGMSCKTTESLIHGIECDPTKNSGASQKYVRAGNLPPSEDLKNYDLGRTSLAVVNPPQGYAGQQIGELWVSYTVKLRKPKFVSGNAYNVMRDFFCMDKFILAGTIPTTAVILNGARNSLGSVLTRGLNANVNPGPLADILTSPTIFPVPGTIVPHLQLTLPDSYSGILRINILAYAPNWITAVLPTLVSSNSTTMLRFRDIPLGLTYGANLVETQNANSWSHFKIDGVEGPNPTIAIGRGQAEYHLRVLPATAGTKNILYITFQGYTNTPDVRVSVEVTQYNSFLSYQDNGKQDDVSLVSSLTNQAVVWA